MRRTSRPTSTAYSCSVVSEEPGEGACARGAQAHDEDLAVSTLSVQSGSSGYTVVAPPAFTTVAGDTVHRLTPSTLDADQDADKVCWLLLLKDLGRKRWFASRAKRISAAGSA